MKQIKFITASFAILLAIATTAFTKDSHSAIFDDYYSSRYVEPTQSSEFDSNVALPISSLKSYFCTGPAIVVCRYLWLASHVIFDVSGTPTGIARDSSSGLPYQADAIVYGPH